MCPEEWSQRRKPTKRTKEYPSNGWHTKILGINFFFKTSYYLRHHNGYMLDRKGLSNARRSCQLSLKIDVITSCEGKKWVIIYQLYCLTVSKDRRQSVRVYGFLRLFRLLQWSQLRRLLNMSMKSCRVPWRNSRILCHLSWQLCCSHSKEGFNNTI